jgi:transposase-like protein
MGLACRHCGSERTRKNGTGGGVQRHLCRDCGRTFVERAPRYGAALRARAVHMHLNNVGVRKIALFLGCSPASVVNWVRAAHRDLAERLRQAADRVEAGAVPDVVEMDEIYTWVQKNSSAPWCGLPTHDGRLVLWPLRSATRV